MRAELEDRFAHRSSWTARVVLHTLASRAGKLDPASSTGWATAPSGDAVPEGGIQWNDPRNELGLADEPFRYGVTQLGISDRRSIR
jgi:hypothetical protein